MVQAFIDTANLTAWNCEVPATSRVGRRQLLALAAVAPLAANAEDPPVDCLASCIAECTKLAPGNDAYRCHP